MNRPPVRQQANRKNGEQAARRPASAATRPPPLTRQQNTGNRDEQRQRNQGAACGSGLPTRRQQHWQRCQGRARPTKPSVLRMQME